MPGYYSIRLSRVLWRGARQILVEYNVLNGGVNFPPGMFVLFWYPGLEAIPLTPIQLKKNVLTFLVAVRGDTTKAFYKQPPQYAGIIGPLGREYKLPSSLEEALFIAGGVGLAALAPLILQGLRLGVKITLVYAARTARELVPLGFLGLDGVERLIIATEDGTLGVQGTAIDALKQIDLERFNAIYAAGPLGMLYKLSDRVENTVKHKVIVAVETRVRCGLGFCCECTIAGRYRLCVDGMFYSLKDVERWIKEACQQM